MWQAERHEFRGEFAGADHGSLSIYALFTAVKINLIPYESLAII